MSSSDTSAASTVAMAGDWHGSWKHAGPALADIGERGITTVLHAGDFGIWPGPSGRAFLDHVTGRATRYGMTIYVTPGNHEDWSRLLRIEPKQRDELGALLWVSDRVAVFPRDPAGTASPSPDARSSASAALPRSTSIRAVAARTGGPRR